MKFEMACMNFEEERGKIETNKENNTKNTPSRMRIHVLPLQEKNSKRQQSLQWKRGLASRKGCMRRQSYCIFLTIPINFNLSYLFHDQIRSLKL
jgi:hypothetical protein